MASNCAAAFLSAQLNLRRFDKYETWFDENSTMTLAQAGVYKGVDDILEYMKFILPSSPYISVNGLLRSDASLVGVPVPDAGRSPGGR